MIKKLFSIVLGMLMMLFNQLTTEANEKTLAEFFEKYSEMEGVTFVNITPEPEMLESLMGSAKIDNNDMKTMLKDIKTIKILSIDDDDKSSQKAGKYSEAKKLYKQALSLVKVEKFKQFMEVKENGTKVKMLYKGEKNNVSEFLLLVYEHGELTLIWIDGKIDLSDIPKLQKMMGVGK